MNHLESAFEGKNTFWRYLVMFAAIMLMINTFGSLPMLIALAIKSVSNPDVFSQLAANPNNLGAAGLDLNLGLVLMIIPFIFGLATIVLMVKPLHQRTFTMTINGTGKIRWNRFFISGGVYTFLSAIYLITCYELHPSNFTLNNTTASLITLSVITVALIPFQATFEEVLFRGYIMQGFAVIARNRWFPLLMTALLFGLMHAFNPEVKEFGFFTMIPQYILFGLIFGIITIMDDGIEASMGAHTANNAFLCIMVTQKSSALQTPALLEQTKIYPWTEFFALLFVGLLLVLILKVIFKWEDFSRLFGKIKPEKVVNQIP